MTRSLSGNGYLSGSALVVQRDFWLGIFLLSSALVISLTVVLRRGLSKAPVVFSMIARGLHYFGLAAACGKGTASHV